MDILNGAIDSLIGSSSRDDWTPVALNVADATVTISKDKVRQVWCCWALMMQSHQTPSKVLPRVKSVGNSRIFAPNVWFIVPCLRTYYVEHMQKGVCNLRIRSPPPTNTDQNEWRCVYVDCWLVAGRNRKRRLLHSWLTWKTEEKKTHNGWKTQAVPEVDTFHTWLHFAFLQDWLKNQQHHEAKLPPKLKYFNSSKPGFASVCVGQGWYTAPHCISSSV